jgi:ethanolaminephosphotransferase
MLLQPSAYLHPLTYIQFCKRAQKILSSTASNYDMSAIACGMVLAGLSAVMAIAASLYVFRRLSASLNALGVITLTYGLMMFGSSYVEEEQNFWYWIASGWVTFLATKRCAPKDTSTLKLCCSLIPFLLRPSFSLPAIVPHGEVLTR